MTSKQRGSRPKLNSAPPPSNVLETTPEQRLAQTERENDVQDRWVNSLTYEYAPTISSR
jgi:hypothetical protein